MTIALKSEIMKGASMNGSRYFLLSLNLILITTGFSQKYTGSEKQINIILNNVAKFSEYVVNSNYEKIASAYTNDGKIFPNNREIIEGRSAIMNYWKLPEGVRTIAHKISPLEIKIKGKEAYDYGVYEGSTRRADGSEVSWKGKYVIVWRKEKKEWKMYLDIWNRIQT